MRSLYALLVACSSAASAPQPSAKAVTKHEAPKLAPLPVIGTTANHADVNTVRVVAQVDEGVATDRPAYARKDQKVTLHALVHAGDWFGDVASAKLDGKTIAVKPLAEAPRITIAW